MNLVVIKVINKMIVIAQFLTDFCQATAKYLRELREELIER